MQDQILQDLRAKKCIITGEYLNNNGEPPFNMVGCNRSNQIILKRNNVTFNVTITLLFNKKSVTIFSDSETQAEAFYSIAMDIMRFENLFDGRFFPVSSFLIDEEEYFPKIEKHLLGYFQSNTMFAWISHDMTNREYKTLFLRFKKIVDKNILRHNAYLYAAYSKGITADLRTAVLIQIFEPLAKELKENGKIQIITRKNTAKPSICPNCGKTLPQKHARITMNDRLTALLKKYGREIFAGESQTRIIKRTVNIRNRVDHLNKKSRNYLSGEQCGFYIWKYELLYRVILMQELGIDYSEIKDEIVSSVKMYNNRFPQFRIMR